MSASFAPAATTAIHLLPYSPGLLAHPWTHSCRSSLAFAPTEIRLCVIAPSLSLLSSTQTVCVGLLREQPLGARAHTCGAHAEGEAESDGNISDVLLDLAFEEDAEDVPSGADLHCCPNQRLRACGRTWCGPIRLTVRSRRTSA